MATDLIIAVSDAENVKPYKFEATNICVYSFEQALYHCYHYWKESWDEIFIKDDFIAWVRDELNLLYIVSEIKKMKNIRSLSDRITAFLSIVYYFDDDEIDKLKEEIKNWQTQSQSEKLKEKGDSLISIGSFEKAIITYKAVLTYDKKNFVVMNNIGVGYMNLENYEKAKRWFLKAFEICRDNFKIIMNIVEVCIYNGDYDEAQSYLNLAESAGNGEIFYFKGEIEFGRGNYDDAVAYYKKAIMKNDSFALFGLSDVYAKQGMFDMALKVLDMFNDANVTALIKKSEVYLKINNMPAAIKYIEKALLHDRTSVRLWTYLAKYHRLNSDFKKAENAIRTALRFSEDSLEANLEMAKIKRVQGKIKEYEDFINKIFRNLKTEYRDIYF